MQSINVLGPLIRKLRIESGLSQKELAGCCEKRGLHLSRGTLAKIESRVRFITASELFIIAKVLKKPMERFYPLHYGALVPAAIG